MSLQAILGQKIEQTQKFLEDGTRIPVTRLWVLGNTVVSVKTQDKEKYNAIQLGFGTKKKATKALLGHIKGASLKAAPKFLQEVRIDGEDMSSLPSVGEAISATEVFKPGDIVNVIGVSKGKGYAGVVKRHHFKGGPRTHGQSDRERAPGSIGQTTTPGRVYKGKRMAGRMGHARVTVRNLEVVDVLEDTLFIKGLVPGGKNTLIMVRKVGESKKFIPLFKESKDAEQLAHAEGDARLVEETLGSVQPHSEGDAQFVSDEAPIKESTSLSDDSKIEVNLKDKASENAVINSPQNGPDASSEVLNKEIKKEEVENAG